MSSGLPSSGYHVAWHSVLRGYDATLKSMTSLTRFAWPFDQFKRHVYDPRAASATSALASLFWYACVTAFAAVAITNFINRPEVDTFSVMPAKELPPLEITIETKCSEEWGCTPNAQPLPALFSMGPCPYEPGFNRSYTCVNHKPNALNSTLDQVRERDDPQALNEVLVLCVSCNSANSPPTNSCPLSDVTTAGAPYLLSTCCRNA